MNRALVWLLSVGAGVCVGAGLAIAGAQGMIPIAAALIAAGVVRILLR